MILGSGWGGRALSTVGSAIMDTAMGGLLLDPKPEINHFEERIVKTDYVLSLAKLIRACHKVKMQNPSLDLFNVPDLCKAELLRVRALPGRLIDPVPSDSSDSSNDDKGLNANDP